MNSAESVATLFAFDLTLADGREVRRVRIQGNGGEIGAGSAHCIGTPSEESARHAALLRVRQLIRFANEGRSLPVYEPEPGCVKLYHGPFANDPADEVTEVVSLVGARARLSPRRCREGADK